MKYTYPKIEELGNQMITPEYPYCIKIGDKYLHENNTIHDSISNGRSYAGIFSKEEAQRTLNAHLKGIFGEVPEIINEKFEDNTSGFSIKIGDGYVIPRGSGSFGVNENKWFFIKKERVEEALSFLYNKALPKKENYVTFQEGTHLKEYNMPYPINHIFLKIYASSKEDVANILIQEFGEKSWYGIYNEQERKIINRGTNFIYDTLCLFEIQEAKKITPLKGQTKELFISGKLAKALIDSEYSLKEFFNKRSIIHGEFTLGYCVPSTNNFKSDHNNLLDLINNSKIVIGKEEVRLGRLIKAFSGYADTHIEKIVSSFKSKYEIDTSMVQVSANVGEIYNISECGGSCMAMKPRNWFDIYEDMGTKIAYITDSNGRLTARALLHEVVEIEHPEKEYMMLDRIFYNSEKSKLTLRKWAKEKGITLGEDINCDIRGKYPIKEAYNAVPYVDTLQYAITIDAGYYLATDYAYANTHCVDLLHQTNGQSDDRVISPCMDGLVYCTDTDSYEHEDDAYYCETDNKYYRYDDDLVSIEEAGYYLIDDENIAYDEYRQEWAFTSDLNYSKSENIYTSSKDYTYIDKGSYKGSYEYYGDCYYCDDISGYVYEGDENFIEDKDYYVYDTDGYYHHSNGSWYSYMEEEEEIA